MNERTDQDDPVTAAGHAQVVRTNHDWSVARLSLFSFAMALALSALFVGCNIVWFDRFSHDLAEWSFILIPVGGVLFVVWKERRFRRHLHLALFGLVYGAISGALYPAFFEWREYEYRHRASDVFASITGERTIEYARDHEIHTISDPSTDTFYTVRMVVPKSPFGNADIVGCSAGFALAGGLVALLAGSMTRLVRRRLVHASRAVAIEDSG